MPTNDPADHARLQAAFAAGFTKVSREHGIEPAALVKKAQLGPGFESDNDRVWKYVKTRVGDTAQGFLERILGKRNKAIIHNPGTTMPSYDQRHQELPEIKDYRESLQARALPYNRYDAAARQRAAAQAPAPAPAPALALAPSAPGWQPGQPPPTHRTGGYAPQAPPKSRVVTAGAKQAAVKIPKIPKRTEPIQLTFDTLMDRLRGAGPEQAKQIHAQLKEIMPGYSGEKVPSGGGKRTGGVRDAGYPFAKKTKGTNRK